MKHTLGLKHQFGRDGFRLLYLWYDALGEDGTRHRDEVGELASVAKKDGIRFHSLTCQELIAKLANEFHLGHNIWILANGPCHDLLHENLSTAGMYLEKVQDTAAMRC